MGQQALIWRAAMIEDAPLADTGVHPILHFEQTALLNGSTVAGGPILFAQKQERY